MIFRKIRLFLSILCAIFLVYEEDLAVYAQLDTKGLQNRNIRDVRNTHGASPAATMMQEMRESLQQLPWNDLSATAQAKIKSVVSGTPLFHRMPQQTIYSDPEIYHFLLEHPDIIIGFWEQLGATQLSLLEIKENRYILKETSGTVATVEVLYRTNDICIAYARGEYRGPLLAKAYQGDVILVLRTQFTRDETNEPMVICDLDTFVKINSLGADVLAKLFFSSLTKVADNNFDVTISFVGQVFQAVARNTDTLKATAKEISSVREEVCTEFCEVVDRAAMRCTYRNRPAPLVFAQPQYRSLEVSKTEHLDFTLSIKPPTDWELDHFFDTPLSPYTAVRHEKTNELSVPKSLSPNAAEFVIPRLPKRTK